MSKLKVLEVNNIDTIGNRFNGYDMISELSNKNLEIKQAVVNKLSDNKKVIELIKNDEIKQCYEKFEGFENEMSIRNVFSITTASLMQLKEYKEADIIHFHQFHNTRLSLYSLRKISREKKVIISLHDPWFITGRCIHFYDCKKWKSGCIDCPNIKNMFEFREDNCNDMYNLKKLSVEGLDIDIAVPTDWMLNLVKESPILKGIKHVHKIPFGIDIDKFGKVSNKEARKYFDIPSDNIVLYLRANNEFKGTEYVLEALKNLKINKKITVLTCDNKHLLDEVKNKYNIIDLGVIGDEEMIRAMNACDIFLMPSIGESFGMMAIEAMACKKPVIVFNNSALPSVTKAPECGYLVKNRDAKDLEKAIKHLIEDEKDRKQRGAQGYKIAKKEYNNETYNERLKKMYSEVAERKRIEVKDAEYKIDTENLNQFKLRLNDLTIRLLGISFSKDRELLFDTKDIKRNKKYKIKYADKYVQEILLDYEIKLEKVLEEDKIEHSLKIKMEKLVYFMKNNPKYFIDIVKNIIDFRLHKH